jgi:hypothetical protein
MRLVAHTTERQAAGRAAAPILHRQASPSAAAEQVEDGACSCGGGCPRCADTTLQPKLVVSEPGDALEQEADRVAEAVMAGGRVGGVGVAEAPGLQRCGAIPADACPCHDAPAEVGEVLRSPGEGLDGETRSQMEPRFGRDFGEVRVHRDGRAAASARAVNALAYTVGRDIVFGAGQYTPGTVAGRRLLAHELTHVVQQQAGLAAYRLQRAETDTSTCAALTDSKSDVNTVINVALSKARSNAGSPPNADKVIDGLFDILAKNTSVGRSAIEDWAANLPAAKVKLPPQSSTKYKGVTYGIWSNPIFPILNPSMKVNGICIGSDKLGHFLQQGHEYYDAVRRQGAGVATAVELLGERTEGGGYGLSTTGVYSRADLAANRQGLQLYDDLAANPALTFDISKYISSQWNEESNPSYYENGVAKQVWSNLLSRTWNASFDLGGAATTPISVTLAATTAGTVTGTYTYTSSAGNVINGTIRNGKITYNTTTVKGYDLGVFGSTKVNKTPVSGVTIEFEWQEGAASGRGTWASVSESELRGTWGTGAAATGAGNWNLK